MSLGSRWLHSRPVWFDHDNQSLGTRVSLSRHASTACLFAADDDVISALYRIAALQDAGSNRFL
jgi:hypothetical protein